MAASRVLKVPQSENEADFILLQVSSSGKKPLDLKLIATEGEAPYVVKTRHDRIASLKVQNSPLSDSEWERTLEAFFNQEPLHDVNAMATVQSEQSISITIRKQVKGITQRLGTITLAHNANEAIELLEWCAASADAVTESKKTTATVQAKATELDASIRQLKEQLDELLKAKDEDETALLQKFRDLLNEKKVKIREQQKVLASGSFITSTPKEEELQADAPSEPESAVKPKGRGRKPAASRAGKRKAAAPVKEESEDEDEVPEVEMADETRIKAEPDETHDGHTTEATASADEADDSDDEMITEADAPPPPRQATPPKTIAAPPAKRDLPFVNRKAKAAPTLATAAGGAESDSDDEL